MAKNVKTSHLHFLYKYFYTFKIAEFQRFLPFLHFYKKIEVDFFICSFEALYFGACKTCKSVKRLG